jgi:hypothetical protein
MDTWSSPEFCNDAISSYKHLFCRLKAPTNEQLTGQYMAQFVGPSWLRFLAPKLLPLGGLSGWAGKSFSADNAAINLLNQKGQLVERVPMVRALCASSVDADEALVLTYDSRAPIMLRSLVDELRTLDSDTLLGLTHMKVPLLKHLLMPFVLHRIKD